MTIGGVSISTGRLLIVALVAIIGEFMLQYIVNRYRL